jgi:high-affinity iron transporter
MSSRRPSCVVAVVLALAIGLGGAAFGATAEQTRVAARVLALLRGVAGEYAEAFDAEGRLARPVELEEAGLLLGEARDLIPRLGLDAADVGRIERAIADRASQDVVDGLVGGLAGRVTAATGVALQELPPAAPSEARGAALFHENCAGCHGADGRGDGEESRRLGLAPANFTDAAFMRTETPDDFFNVVTLGRRRSGMPAWTDALSVQDRWDVVRFVWSFTHPGAAVERGRAILATSCAACGDAIADPPAAVVRSSDADLSAALESGPAGAQVAALDAPARDAVVAALRARAFDGLVAPAGTATDTAATQRTAREAFAEVHGLLDQVVARRSAGDSAATGLATDAYMRFEPFEKRLGAVEPGLVRRVEEGFVRLRQSVRDAAPASEVTALVAVLHHDLDQAAAALEPGAGAWIRFAQSAGIILREGFEVVLVVGALLAYVRRSGQAAMVRALYLGSAVGVVASVATAIVLVTLLRVTPWAGEALEGAAMLLAAVVLFWVSYWLVSKAEADRWQRYIRGRVQGALTAGSTTALATAAFLAVYREGFETILFYQALFASAPPGDVMLPAGLLAGLVLLAIVYAGLERVGLRIPMAQFFLVTGGFLYAMAIVFAGRGVAELQEAGLVRLTPLDWAPRIETLGIFPTVESLAAQGVFVGLLVYAIAITWTRRRARRAAAVETPPTPRKVAQG